MCSSQSVVFHSIGSLSRTECQKPVFQAERHLKEFATEATANRKRIESASNLPSLSFQGGAKYT